ncbi:Uncharacterised protein [Yersinia enterocolitica]|nr:Uncharacterised protein [Yersinia enterocolitica]
MRTNHAELMDSSHSANNGKIVDFYMTTQCCIIRKNTTIADDAVMGYVGIDHQ